MDDSCRRILKHVYAVGEVMEKGGSAEWAHTVGNESVESLGQRGQAAVHNTSLPRASWKNDYNSLIQKKADINDLKIAD